MKLQFISISPVLSNKFGDIGNLGFGWGNGKVAAVWAMKYLWGKKLQT